jgi:hypothetical protein
LKSPQVVSKLEKVSSIVSYNSGFTSASSTNGKALLNYGDSGSVLKFKSSSERTPSGMYASVKAGSDNDKTLVSEESVKVTKAETPFHV